MKVENRTKKEGERVSGRGD